MLSISVEQRRARLVRRHRLAPECAASSVVDAADSVVVLHATDPATVYLSALARCPDASLADISTAMYDERTLVKMIGMRRTMFVAPTPLAPVVHAAAGLEIAARLRRQLVKQLQTLPTEPEIGDDVESWLADVETSTERALAGMGEAFANELAEAEPRLRTAILPTTEKKWDVKQNITSRVLTLMGADGRLVRGRPGGTWLSRMHRWMSTRELWPDGMPETPELEARVALARAWLRAFGPGTVADLKWWTGWTLGSTRKVLTEIDTVEVDLDGDVGVVLADDVEPEEAVEPSAALLPALDPTPMGWQQRDFYLGPHREPLFDRNGNIGPTVWWDGRIVGGWGMKNGEIVWRMLEDVGAEAETAVAKVAAGLQDRLEAATVVPSFRTPLETSLTT
ncbi:winged helix DNA-binding domain-containing protein [Phytoactinopolyspora halotolerans]|uniref:winged helix DNA-binding domain-containing protein n=1 Tax=Phytoactinopolyspora halotolerans TaxID=1981512 RepID=UPI001C206604|nr:winged helix DNA-binding domain-containing protein [Phytoactinopolyspora halotolerans]